MIETTGRVRMLAPRLEGGLDIADVVSPNLRIAGRPAVWQAEPRHRAHPSRTCSGLPRPPSRAAASADAGPADRKMLPLVFSHIRAPLSLGVLDQTKRQEKRP